MLNRHAARFCRSTAPSRDRSTAAGAPAASGTTSPRRISTTATAGSARAAKKAGRVRLPRPYSEELALENARLRRKFFNDRMEAVPPAKLLQRLCGALLDGLCPAPSPVLQRKRPHERPRRSLPDQKQALTASALCQSEAPAVKIIGHWNYPRPTALQLSLKKSVRLGRAPASAPRPAHNKTVYVTASYPVAAVRLLVGRAPSAVATNRKTLCPRIVTQSRLGRGRGLGCDATPSASDRLKAADSPPPRLTLHTAPGGLAAVGPTSPMSCARTAPGRSARSAMRASFTLDIDPRVCRRLAALKAATRRQRHRKTMSMLSWHQPRISACGLAPGTIRLTAVMGDLRNVITLPTTPPTFRR